VGRFSKNCFTVDGAAKEKRENLLRNLHRRIFFKKKFCYEVIVKQNF
jgi:hypothetical protein